MIPVIDIIGSVIGKVLDKIPDAGKKAELQLEITKELNRNQETILASLSAIDQKQAEINIEEAKSSNLFVAGWRPFVGWTSAAGVMWAFVLKPVADWILAVSGSTVTTPTLNTGELMSLLLGLLGMAGLRSFEKYQEVDHRH